MKNHKLDSLALGPKNCPLEVARLQPKDAVDQLIIGIANLMPSIYQFDVKLSIFWKFSFKLLGELII